MGSLGEFFTELLKIEIKTVDRFKTPAGIKLNISPANHTSVAFPIVKVLDMSHYDRNDKVCPYDLKLQDLQQKAISEILNLSPEQGKRQLKYLEGFVLPKYSLFFPLISKHKQLFRNGEFDQMDFYLEVESLFVSNHEEGAVTVQYFNSWNEAIITKQANVKEFIYKVKHTIGFDKADQKSLGTHREEVMAYNYRVKAGQADAKTPARWEEDVNAKRKQAAYSVTKGGSTKYKAPTEKELLTVIEILKDFPEAKQYAQQDLASLQNL